MTRPQHDPANAGQDPASWRRARRRDSRRRREPWARAAGRDADPTRLCQRLQTRRDIHTVTEEVVLLNSSLAAIYHHQGRLTEEIGAWERASALLPYPALELLALGYAELAARRPQRALQEFEKAALSLPPGRERQADERFFASLARGRATALSAIGQQR